MTFTPAQLTLLVTCVTVCAYLIGNSLYLRSGRKVWIHPVVMGSALLGLFITLAPLSYDVYWEHSEIFRFGLGLVTVALAVPLFREMRQLRELFFPALLTICIGSVIAPLASMLCALLLGLSSEVVLTFITKSISTPIALTLAEHFGTLMMLATAITVFTGVIGALIAPTLFRWIQLHDPRLQGIILGINAHGVGTIRAFEISRAAGALAGLSMGLTGCVSVLTLPWVFKLFVM